MTDGDMNKHDMHPDITMSAYRKGTSTLEKCLIAVVMILFLLTIIFLGLFIHYYIRYDETEKKNASTPGSGPAGQAAGTICNTHDCVRAAGLMANKMNESASPCEDFHEYACGRYNKVTILPEGSVQTGSLYAINDENQLVMREMLTEDVLPEQPVYLQNMKRLYKSCINEVQIENLGLQPYWRDTDFSRDWPTLNPDWDGSSFNLREVLARYGSVDVFPLLQPGVLADFINSSKRSLFLVPGDFGLSQEYFSREDNDPILVAFRTYIAEFAVALGANKTIAEQDALELMSLLTSLSKILPSQVDSRNLQKMYNPMIMKELSTLYPSVLSPSTSSYSGMEYQIYLCNYNTTEARVWCVDRQLDIPRILRQSFAIANMTYADDDVVINTAPNYIGNISLVLSNYSNRAVQNLFGFKYAKTRVENLTKRMREIRLAFDMVHLGQETESPRWSDCVNLVSGVFSKGMAKQFVERTFPEKAKVYAETMVENLESAFRNILLESTWMSSATKKKALKKLAAMGQKVGYPDEKFTDDDINKKYENYLMLEDDYYSNMVLTDRLAGLASKQSLRKPVDKTEWISSPHELNAKYSLSGNEILMHAAILQSPVFSVTFQDSMNYGAIGAVMGHEITHGFDYSGSQFDENGNLAVWWQGSDFTVFLERIECLVDQYSSFHITDINMNVDGILTKNENVADNGGLKESYRAYKELVKKKGESPTLPGLGLTQDQLFFLAYGQMWCEKVTQEGLINTININSHPPGKYRIIGVLQNSEDFSRAYNCPRGSYMNPEKKCSVW